MHPLTTIAKLNREAEEAARLLNARSPAAVAVVDNSTANQVRAQRAHAQETIARITEAAKDAGLYDHQRRAIAEMLDRPAVYPIV